jgi:hypothetical protein
MKSTIDAIAVGCRVRHGQLRAVAEDEVRVAGELERAMDIDIALDEVSAAAETDVAIRAGDGQGLGAVVIVIIGCLVAIVVVQLAVLIEYGIFALPTLLDVSVEPSSIVT